MKYKNPIIICGLICATLIICGVFLWPTIYRYEKTQSKLVRINRITGYTEILSESLWEPVAKREPFNVNDYIPQVQVIPKEEIAKIEIGGSFDGEGRYKLGVYNGSDWTIKIIKVSIELNDGKGKKYWQRIYETTADIRPFSAGSCSIKLMDIDKKADGYTLHELEAELARRGFSEVRIKEALGYKDK